MKKSFKKTWPFFSVIAFTILFLGILISNLVNLRRDEVMVNVQQKLPKHTEETFPVINNYTYAAIKGDQVLVLKDDKLFLKFVAPRTEWLMDNLHALALFICSLITLYFFWGYDKEKPFAGRLSSYMNSIGGILFISYGLNLLRALLFNKQVLALTNNEYIFASRSFENPEFWTSLILLRLAYVIKKGEHLQQEQDLTV